MESQGAWCLSMVRKLQSEFFLNSFSFAKFLDQCFRTRSEKETASVSSESRNEEEICRLNSLKLTNMGQFVSLYFGKMDEYFIWDDLEDWLGVI